MMAAAIRVLYVDDESALLELGKMFLERAGDITVTIATSAPDAIRLLERESFDTIVSDYQMPEMDGVEFLVLVRTKFGQIPFILFTGKGREEVVIEALNAGADGYLQKGSEPKSQFAELSHKIKSAVERKQAEDALKRSEENYRHLIEHSDEAIVVAQDGVLKLVNHRAVELTGYSEQELLSMSFLVFIHPDDRAMVMERYQKRMKREESPSRYAFRISPKDGSIRWVEINVAAIDWDGRPATLNFLTDITERKQAEDALAKSEERNRSIVEALPGLVFHFSADGRFIDCQFNNAELLLLQPDHVIGKQVVEILPPNLAHLTERKLRETLDSGQLQTFEYSLTLQNQERFFEARMTPGGTNSVMTFVHEITERKRAKEALVESESFNRNLIENLPDYIGVTTPDGKILYMNPPAMKALGYTVEDLIGTSVLSYVAEECRDDVISRMAARYEGGEVPPYEIDILSRDRRRISVIVKGTTIQYRDTPALLLVLTDITESKRVKDALQKNLTLYRGIIEVTDTGFVILDQKGNVIDANQEYLRLSGHENISQIRGRNVVEWTADYEKEKNAEAINKCFRDGQTRNLKIDYVNAKGKITPIEINASVVKVDGAQQILTLCRDITERRQAEETIRHALAEKEVLLREIHHRVKNNLAGILALIELQIRSLSDPAAISLLKDMETRIRSMALVHESLYLTEDLARINVAGYTETLTRHLFQVYRTATEVRCTIDMGDVAMSIETAIPCGLVMNEIVTNSLKYAFPDTFSCEEIRGEPCTITLTLHREGSDYLLEISDNGTGIPEGIDVTMSHSLGLFLIRFIVEHQLRGSLEISTAGGTAYTIRFPEPEVKERHSDE